MSDVLSQSEIDALLSVLSKGDVELEQGILKEETQKIKKYDFSAPQKFSKDHMKVLELIHDNFAKHFSNYLSAQVRTNIKIEIKSIEQITYGEFVSSVQTPTLLAFLKIPPLQGSIIFDLNAKFGFKVLDSLLGGTGERETINKEFTEIDKNILFQVVEWISECLEISWKEYVEISASVEKIETNPGVNLILSHNEPVALISFSAQFNDTVLFLNLCIPYLTVEKFIDKFVIKYKFDTSNEGDLEETKELIFDGLSSVKVPVIAEIGRTKITVNDFLKLGIDDVIKLDSLCVNPIDILINSKKCFIARPGIIGKNNGVEILNIKDRDVSSDE